MATASIAPPSKLCCVFDQLQLQGNHPSWKTYDEDGHHEETECSVMMSPFLAYDDGYTFPNIYAEMHEMIGANILIYPLAELRRFAREGVALLGPPIDKLPTASKNIVKTYKANRQLVEACGLNKKLNSMILSTADDREAVAEQERMLIEEDDLWMLDHQSNRRDEDASDVVTVSVGDDSSTSTTFISSEDAWGLDPLDNSKVLAIEDRHMRLKGLVYMVQLDPCRRRIVLAFRGSVTDTNWVTGFQSDVKSIPNPNKRRCPTQESHVQIHSYFHDVLYSSHDAGKDDKTISVLQHILRDHVYPIAIKYPRYKLYITGYSAGAALATLFAFEAAAQLDSLVPKPVTLVSFGSPCVGDDSFLQSFQYLETLGKLRAIRVANQKDYLPLTPKISSFSVFKHGGMALNLMREEKYALSYPKVGEAKYRNTADVLDGLVDGWDQLLFSSLDWKPGHQVTLIEHSLREYNLRLLMNRPGLESLALNDLYAKRDLVGGLVPEV